MSKIINQRLANDINNAYAPMDKATELKCIVLAQNGDFVARNKLVHSQLRKIASIARGYADVRNPIEDLISEGTIGLCEAIEKFDITSGLRFMSYAQWWVRAKITYQVYDNQPLTVPRNKSKGKAELKDMDGNVIRERIEALKLDIIYLNAPVGEGTVETFIADEDAKTDKKCEFNDYMDHLNALDERDREMIECRIFDELSYEDIGKMFGIKTRESVRQHINKIMVKLRKACRVTVEE